MQKSPLQFAAKAKSNPFKKINDDFKLERSQKAKVKEGVKEVRADARTS